jgi:hypothetical protein
VTKNSNLKFVDNSDFDTAVLFLVFNRFELTVEVFKTIQIAQPPRLYIASDGFRDHVVGEKENVDRIRNFLISNINWDCEVYTLFREKNLGCKYAVSEGISWFFKNEEMGIILEDDCLPSQSFYIYCEELLNKYKNSNDIYFISGLGEPKLANKIDFDYSFTKYPFVWGWASWRRVWKNYDVNISDWTNNQDNLVNSISNNVSTRRYWKKVLQKVYDSKIDTWDYQLSHLILKNYGKCIIPKINLVSNIGFGKNATHTINPDSKFAKRAVHNFDFPLKHPDQKLNNLDIDNFFDVNLFTEKILINKIFLKLKRFFFSSSYEN